MEHKRSWLREPFSGISHFVGAALSLAGMIVLLILAHGRLWYSIGFTIYGLSLIALYTSSTLYHSLHVSEKNQGRLQRFDYIAIFLLIAGTYAPICLTVLHGTVGWSLLGVVYGVALFGIGTILFWRRAPHWVRVVLYVAMGWAALFAFPAMRAALPPNAIVWLVAGGIVYTLGTVVYATDRPNLIPGKFSAHDLWHLFVLGGSACHFITMLYTV